MRSHDPKKGHLFVWNGEFEYAGRFSSSPGISFLTNEDEDYAISMAGAYFLAGNKNPSRVFWSDGENTAMAMYSMGEQGLVYVLDSSRVNPGDRLILCGPIVGDPSKVSKFCHAFQLNSIYVCPLLDELGTFGRLAVELCSQKKDYPRRASLLSSRGGGLPFPVKEYDSVLEGDAYGRMAQSISLGLVVYNQMMRGPGISPFHGQMISALPIFSENVFLVNSDYIDTFLRNAPLSLKRYAATCVPILSPVTDAFRKATKTDLKEAVVFVSSEFVPGLSTFLRFYGTMTKKGFAVSGMMDSSRLTGKLPVFRNDGVYAVESEEFLKKSEPISCCPKNV